MDKSTLVQAKREDWESRTDSDVYEDEMGDYAKQIDTSVVFDFLGKRLRRGARCLDMPCGAGRFSSQLKRQGASVVGGDYNLLMAQTTRRRARIPVVRLEAFSLPFKDSTFDVIVTMRLVFHYADKMKILAELSRVLKKDGVLVFDTLNSYSLRQLIQIPLDAYRGSVGMKLYFATRGTVRSLLLQSGLREEDLRSRFLLPGRMYRYLPRFLVLLVDGVEMILPRFVRGVSYWKATKETSCERARCPLR
jgi:SAM-dependent methyltransferase